MNAWMNDWIEENIRYLQQNEMNSRCHPKLFITLAASEIFFPQMKDVFRNC